MMELSIVLNCFVSGAMVVLQDVVNNKWDKGMIIVFRCILGTVLGVQWTLFLLGVRELTL